MTGDIVTVFTSKQETHMWHMCYRGYDGDVVYKLLIRNMFNCSLAFELMVKSPFNYHKAPLTFTNEPHWSAHEDRDTVLFRRSWFGCLVQIRVRLTVFTPAQTH